MKNSVIYLKNFNMNKICSNCVLNDNININFYVIIVMTL